MITKYIKVSKKYTVQLQIHALGSDCWYNDAIHSKEITSLVMQRIKQRLDLEEEFKYNRSRRRRWKEDAKLATTKYYQPEHVNGLTLRLSYSFEKRPSTKRHLLLTDFGDNKNKVCMDHIVFKEKMIVKAYPLDRFQSVRKAVEEEIHLPKNVIQKSCRTEPCPRKPLSSSSSYFGNQSVALSRDTKHSLKAMLKKQKYLKKERKSRKHTNAIEQSNVLTNSVESSMDCDTHNLSGSCKKSSPCSFELEQADDNNLKDGKIAFYGNLKVINIESDIVPPVSTRSDESEVKSPELPRTEFFEHNAIDNRILPEQDDQNYTVEYSPVSGNVDLQVNHDEDKYSYDYVSDCSTSVTKVHESTAETKFDSIHASVSNKLLSDINAVCSEICENKNTIDCYDFETTENTDVPCQLPDIIRRKRSPQTNEEAFNFSRKKRQKKISPKNQTILNKKRALVNKSSSKCRYKKHNRAAYLKTLASNLFEEISPNSHKMEHCSEGDGSADYNDLLDFNPDESVENDENKQRKESLLPSASFIFAKDKDRITCKNKTDNGFYTLDMPEENYNSETLKRSISSRQLKSKLLTIESDSDTESDFVIDTNSKEDSNTLNENTCPISNDKYIGGNITKSVLNKSSIYTFTSSSDSCGESDCNLKNITIKSQRPKHYNTNFSRSLRLQKTDDETDLPLLSGISCTSKISSPRKLSQNHSASKSPSVKIERLLQTTSSPQDCNANLDKSQPSLQILGNISMEENEFNKKPQTKGTKPGKENKDDTPKDHMEIEDILSDCFILEEFSTDLDNADDQMEMDISQQRNVRDLSDLQVQYMVKKNEIYLRNIFQGKKYCRRHQDYKKGGAIRVDLTYQVRLGIVTEDQQDVVMESLIAMFCKRHHKYLDYIMKVMLPEVLVKIYMDMHNTTHSETEECLLDV